MGGGKEVITTTTRSGKWSATAESLLQRQHFRRPTLPEIKRWDNGYLPNFCGRGGCRKVNKEKRLGAAAAFERERQQQRQHRRQTGRVRARRCASHFEAATRRRCRCLCSGPEGSSQRPRFSPRALQLRGLGAESQGLSVRLSKEGGGGGVDARNGALAGIVLDHTPRRC